MTTPSATHWASVILGLTFLLSAPAAGKTPPCPPGRFALTTGPLIPANTVLPEIQEAVIVNEDGTISIEGTCPAVLGKVKNRGRNVSAQWPESVCLGALGKPKLSATIASKCDEMRGTFRAKKLTRRFKAKRIPGVLLKGGGGESAASALVSQSPTPAAASDIENGLILTQLTVALTPEATVEQVNTALEAVGGRIAAMSEGIPVVTVAIPRANGAVGLQAVVEVLESLPGVLMVLPSHEVGVDVAPPPPANVFPLLEHLQDSRFPAAWNARDAAGDCTKSKVTVIVPDKFEKRLDASHRGFAAQVPGVTPSPTSYPASDPIRFHGYDVLTTLAAKLDRTSPTGANPFPECLAIIALQVGGFGPLDTAMAIDDAIKPLTGKVVVNTSLSFADSCGATPCDPAKLQVVRPTARALSGAVQRLTLLRKGSDLLVVTAAGNNGNSQLGSLYPGIAQAGVSYTMNVAARGDSAMSFVQNASLWAPKLACSPGPCPDLTANSAELAKMNVLLTNLGLVGLAPSENVIIAGSSVVPGVPSGFSNLGSDLFATGQTVPTLNGGRTAGTSFSAPQIAGLVSYLWLVSPDLRAKPVADTIASIRANVNPSTKQLDAYASVLSLDEAVAVTPATAKIRLAILDVDPPPSSSPRVFAFNEDDLQEFHDHYLSGGVPVAGSRDFSRFDLNGDGFTGGGTSARFDLDPTGSLRFGASTYNAVTAQIAGASKSFDENQVTDADVVCFYANSGLYTGDPAKRDKILVDLCSGPSATFAGTITKQTSFNLTICSNPGCAVATQVTNETWSVQLVSQPNGSFKGSGSMTYTASQVSDGVFADGRTCHVEGSQTGTAPGIDYTGTISSPGELHSFMTFSNSVTQTCDGETTSQSEVDTNGVGLPPPTLIFGSAGQLTALDWDIHSTVNQVTGVFTEDITGRLNRLP